MRTSQNRSPIPERFEFILKFTVIFVLSNSHVAHPGHMQLCFQTSRDIYNLCNNGDRMLCLEFVDHQGQNNLALRHLIFFGLYAGEYSFKHFT